MTQIFIGNLSYSTSENDLRSLFERYGSVRSVRMASDRSTGRPRGFAFVSMSRLEDADEAITRLNGTNVSGRAIVVNEAKSSDAQAPSADRVKAMAFWNTI